MLAFILPRNYQDQINILYVIANEIYVKYLTTVKIELHLKCNLVQERNHRRLILNFTLSAILQVFFVFKKLLNHV